MKKEVVILARNINKVFDIRDNRSYSIKQLLFNLFKNIEVKKHEVLEDINLSIHKGEKIALIGRNGSGKTTLCKLLAKIYPPTKGKIIVRGTPVFLTFGVGIDGQLTARENILVSSVLIGLTKKEAEEKVEEILLQADLKAFEHRKISLFSSGMKSRLSFFISVNTKADILFLDEVFAVGDGYFMDKIKNAFKNILMKDKTIILVSHNMTNVLEYSDKVVYLEHGRIKYFGDPQETINMYEEDIAKSKQTT